MARLAHHRRESQPNGAISVTVSRALSGCSGLISTFCSNGNDRRGHQEKRARALGQPGIADRTADLAARLAPAFGQLFRFDVRTAMSSGAGDPHQHIVVRQQIERQIQADPHLQRRERRRGCAIDDGSAPRVPSPIGKLSASSTKIGIRSARQAPEKHQAAMPWPILCSSCSTRRPPVSQSRRSIGRLPPSAEVGRRSQICALALLAKVCSAARGSMRRATHARTRPGSATGCAPCDGTRFGAG